MVKSKTSLFNRCVSKDLLRRFWPLWTSYLALMILLLPVSSYTTFVFRLENYAGWKGMSTVRSIIYSGCPTLVVVALVVGVIAAMAMFGYLYNTKSCGMMNALPLKRDTMFITAYLTGLLPLIAANVIAELITMLALAVAGAADVLCVLNRLALSVMCTVTFYGFAVFCAMLTGNMLVLPLLYAALNCAAWICEGCLRHILSEFVYGMTVQTHIFDWLSPAVVLTNEVGIKYVDGEAVFTGMGLAAAYCAAGIAFSFAALLLYRRRSMESASDTVAIPWLKPVFKYCMTFGGALVMAYALFSLYFYGTRGYATAGGELLLMLLGAFVGYFLARMIIHKSIDVFRKDWRGFIVSACIIVAFVACAELDVLGFEKRTPDPESVSRASIYYSTDYEQPDNIRDIVALQKQIMAHKAENEQAEYLSYINFEYTLKNGKLIKRAYQVDFTDAAQNSPESDVGKAQELLNRQEAIERRTALRLPVTPVTVEYATIEWFTDDEAGYYGESFRLTPEQMVELYNECVLPDIADGTIGLEWMTWGDGYYDTATNVSINFSLRQNDPDMPMGIQRASLYLNVTTVSERTLAWIAENTEIECLPLRVASPPVDEDPVALGIVD